MLENTAAKKKSPKKDPQNAPQSKTSCSSFNSITTYAYIKLAKRLQLIRKSIPKNLPKINSQIEIGFVKSKAIVPDLISSEKAFIPIAGIRNKNNQGINSKYKLRSAKPESTRLNAFAKTQRSKPFKIKNTASIL